MRRQHTMTGAAAGTSAGASAGTWWATEAAHRIAADALAAAEAAADAAGCLVRPISALPELEATCRLFHGIWQPGAENGLATTELLRAMDKAGSYVAAAFDREAATGARGGGGALAGQAALVGEGALAGEGVLAEGGARGAGGARGTGGALADGSGELVGACIGFFGPPPDGSLHSHIAGVSARMRGRSVGFALKTHQRAWALERGATQVSWTFDPLVRRNAYFNIGKLAARPAQYLPNFYGRMDDGINGADDTDRLLVEWPLAAPEVAAACHGRPRPADATGERARGTAIALGTTPGGRPHAHPVTGSGSRCLVAVPDDIEQLRRTDPPSAADWRAAVRETLGGLLADGWQVAGFDRAGWYLLARPSVTVAAPAAPAVAAAPAADPLSQPTTAPHNPVDTDEERP
ncbi:GNAT family N-acetyltransferase [Streptomyces sp. NPDC059009]|uniref:GNAT family N-acetyltransferase n=1 Tax=Streptomyces sp. NPDC059009 TaxID=3346694 RepID=UPI003682FE01